MQAGSIFFITYTAEPTSESKSMLSLTEKRKRRMLSVTVAGATTALYFVRGVELLPAAGYAAIFHAAGAFFTTGYWDV